MTSMNIANEILEHLFKEEELLKFNLEKCLSEMDYAGAQLYKDAIDKKSIEIRNIRNRIEANLDGINDKRRKISSLEYRIKRNEQSLIKFSNNQNVANAIKERINEIKIELDKLINELAESARTPEFFHIDDENVIEAIEQLFDNQISIVCLEVVGRYNYYISVFRNGGQLFCEIVCGNIRRNQYEIQDYTGKLREIGFRKNKHYNWEWKKSIKVLNEETIHQLVSIVGFEILNLNKESKCNLIMK